MTRVWQIEWLNLAEICAVKDTNRTILYWCKYFGREKAGAEIIIPAHCDIMEEEELSPEEEAATAGGWTGEAGRNLCFTELNN